MVPDDAEQDRPDDKPPAVRPAASERLQGDVTLILTRIEQGEPHAAEELLPLVYSELRRLAAAKMAQEKPGQTLQATALVHEAYIRLVDTEKVPHWNGRAHFYAAAAEAMRRILVEQARRKLGPEAGGRWQRIEMSQIDPPTSRPALDLLALHEALDRLAARDPRKANLVKLRFFAGLSNEQAARVLGVTARTAYADWGYARAWLRVEMAEEPETDV